MGFLRDLSKLAGEITGGVTGGVTKMVGEALGSKEIQKFGDDVKNITVNSFESIGTIADGIVNTGIGIVKDDYNQRDRGINEIKDGGGKIIEGVTQTIGNTFENGFDVIDGIRTNDMAKLNSGVKGIVKTVATAVVVLTPIEAAMIIDGADVADASSIGDTDHHIASNVNMDSHVNDSEVQSHIENPNMHNVQPHWVNGHYQNGQWIEGYWRDGDGDTSVNNNIGYVQHNPDYKA